VRGGRGACACQLQSAEAAVFLGGCLVGLSLRRRRLQNDPPPPPRRPLPVKSMRLPVCLPRSAKGGRGGSLASASSSSLVRSLTTYLPRPHCEATPRYTSW
jgi:hypothetical protein